MDPQQQPQPSPQPAPILPPSVSAPQPPVPSPMSSKHLLLIALITVLLIGGGIALGLYLKNSSTSDTVSLEDVNKTQSDDEAAKKQAEADAKQNAEVFKGVQMKARDTERQTDVNALSTHLEVYYNDHGAYPTYEQLKDKTWVVANLAGLDTEAFNAPLIKTNSLILSKTPNKDQYGYTPLDSMGKACTSLQYCAQFKIYWYQETTGQVNTKSSLN
jgi:hypothetical protein